MSKNLKEIAKDKGWWDPNTSETFDWKNVIGEASNVPATKLTTPEERYLAGKKLLETFAEGGTKIFQSSIDPSSHAFLSGTAKKH